MVYKLIDIAENTDSVYLIINRSQSESLIDNFRTEGIRNDSLVYCLYVDKALQKTKLQLPIRKQIFVFIKIKILGEIIEENKPHVQI
jgi:hypothetical protein